MISDVTQDPAELTTKFHPMKKAVPQRGTAFSLIAFTPINQVRLPVGSGFALIPQMQGPRQHHFQGLMVR